MRVRITALALAAAVFVGRTAAAQETFETIGNDLDNAGDDIIHIWSAPLRLSDADLPTLIAIAEAMLLTGGFDGQIQTWVREHPESPPLRGVGPFRDSQPLSGLGYTKTLLSLSGALYLAGLALGSDPLREAGIGCATADLSNTLARHALARLLGRLRPQYERGPYVIRPLAFGDWPMRSFPGGHAANIMSCTAFWGNRFELGLAEPALYLLAIGLGLGRVPDGAHWLSDTLFGFVFGWAVGDEVAERFLGRESAAEAARAAEAEATLSPRVYFGWRIRL